MQLSGNGGQDWTSPLNAAESGDRPDFPAVAVAPNGSELYVVYDGFTTPFQSTNDSPRRFQGVVRAAPLTGMPPTACPPKFGNTDIFGGKYPG